MALTVLLVGSGAVENAWGPVRDALATVYPLIPKEPGDENLAFASIVFRLRWLAQMKAQKPGETTFAEALDGQLRTYETLQKTIAEKLSEAMKVGGIRVRAQASRLEELFTDELQVVTTNWDSSIEGCWKTGRPIIYLHGHMSDPATLYLPSESIEEPYRKGPTRPGYLANVAGKTMAALHVAQRLVVYGLSMSPLDPELGMVIGDGLVRPAVPLTEGFVVDPRPGIIQERLRFYGCNAPMRSLAPPELWPD